jgi:RND family efflux transporter MFP subunit
MAAIALLLRLAACSKPAPMDADTALSAAPQVVTERATLGPIELGPELPARIAASRTADIRARVPGIVLKRVFIEGQDVKEGDLLFQLDPQPLQAALAQAQSEVARTDAARRHAAARLSHNKNLVAGRAVSQQAFEDAINDDRRARAEFAKAQAALKTAQINLDYSAVRAPISGRIGRALVTEGALVGEREATLMARIQVLASVRRHPADLCRPNRPARHGAR